jgi:hypothetical protein
MPLTLNGVLCGRAHRCFPEYEVYVAFPLAIGIILQASHYVVRIQELLKLKTLT